jgi:hypothetical protein
MHLNVHKKMVVTDWFDRLSLLYIIYVCVYHFQIACKGDDFFIILLMKK